MLSFGKQIVKILVSSHMGSTILGKEKMISEWILL